MENELRTVTKSVVNYQFGRMSTYIEIKFEIRSGLTF